MHSISHAFSHDEVADCEDCFLILDTNEKNLFDYHTVNNVETTSFVTPIHKPITLLYKSPIIRVYHFSKFFNKPPPSTATILG
ncbi:MAG: hypothetical protein AB8B65_08460 [Kordia sp.]|uniref:hypothetical protein n=1 Tax=Kordia sp. TaxID=1965332 RepID=UPI00385D980C